jgi:hypothetical protein
MKDYLSIPVKDLSWAREQKPSVQKLFMYCWESNPSGSFWLPLNHDLKRTSFIEARKIITEAGLFRFKSERLVRDGKRTSIWIVYNCKGRAAAKDRKAFERKTMSQSEKG